MQPVDANRSGTVALSRSSEPSPEPRHFGTTPAFWLNLQKAYELEVAEQEAGARIRAEEARHDDTRDASGADLPE